MRTTVFNEKENGNDHNKGGSTAPSLCFDQIKAYPVLAVLH